MRPLTTSLFSLLFFLPLFPLSLLYSLKNCTMDFDDQSLIVCELNQFSSIPDGIPRSASSLNVFGNNIQRVRQSDFTGFSSLTFLNLGSNDISLIDDGAFSELSALTTLRLEYNQLTNLTDHMFQGLHNLSQLNLEMNLIVSISKSAFEPLKNLKELDLSINKLMQFRDTPLQHPLLWRLDLEENQMTSFESDSFQFPLWNLTNLKVGSKSLKKFRVHSDVFPRLGVLDLSGTGAEFEWDVSEKSFLRSVTTLYLNYTKFALEEYEHIFLTVQSVGSLWLESIGRFFDKGLLDFACRIPALTKLDIGQNEIYVFNNSLLQFCTNLTELDLSKNVMTNMTEASLRMLTRLTRLTIENNKLSLIPVSIRNLTSLTFLSFHGNYIGELGCSDFTNLPSLAELDLGTNRISRLDSCVFERLPSLKVLNIESNYITQIKNTFAPSLVQLNLDDNKVTWLPDGAFRNLSSLIDLRLKCAHETFVERYTFEGLTNLINLTYFPFSEHIGIFRGLPRLEKVSMFLTQYRTVRNPTESPGLTELPSLKDVSISVDVDSCFPFTGLLLKGLKKLEAVSFERYCCNDPHYDIFLNSSKIVKLQYKNCMELNLQPELFQPLTQLSTLDITNCGARSLDFLINANLTKLEKLILKENELTVINEVVSVALPSLKYLDLTGNTFLCDCSNSWFIEWAILNEQVQVVNAFQYRCSSPSSQEGNFLLDFNVQSCWEITGFICFMSSSALVLLTLLSSFIFHFLRWQLVYGYYLLLAFLYDTKKRRQGCPHIYDAFVSYNVHDEEWVYGELLPELEGRQGWRLCLHHRDFLPGKPIIENITDAIYSSRKTLCVISRRYLQSEWCSREIQMASFRLFDEQKDVLILLFLEEISSNQLSPFYRMRKLVKSRTYLSWTQARIHKELFWERVRRALESGNEPGDDHNALTANV